MHWSANLLITSAKEAVLFSAIGAAISLAAMATAATSLVPAFGFVLLLEATGLMIVGGAMDLSSSGTARSLSKQLRMLLGRGMPVVEAVSSREERRSTQFTAAIHSVTGLLLFVEALVLAVVLY